MRKFVVAAVATVTLTASGQAVAATPATWVVDDDRKQCPRAEKTSINKAVKAARAGSVIQVCPGRYPESVTVDKPLTLKGDADAVDAVDCFDPAPSQPGDLDPAQHVIIEGGGPSEQELFRLRADDITLEGLVLQGVSSVPLPTDFRLYRRAIDASDAYSGYRIDHNLIRLNTVGIQLGSAGESDSQFDHNCLRQNGWALATDERALINAHIDHNETFSTQTVAFEPALGRVETVTFDHNHSRQDATSYLIQNSADSRVVANTIESSRLGITLGDSNVRLEIAENVIANPFPGNVQLGIGTRPPGAGVPNTDVIVRDNTITGLASSPGLASGDGIVAAAGPNGTLNHSQLVNNVTSDNKRHGIYLRAGNNHNLVIGNIAERNSGTGVYAENALSTIFAGNTMLANALFDARDDAFGSNPWTDNTCLTDNVGGAICGVD
jgi:nitrous oxidase accessory protein NosD